MTLCYARLDLHAQRLALVDCGHTGVIHFHGKTSLCTMVHGNNLPLGIRAGEVYEQISVAFEPGDVLLFYSDGVTEARNPLASCLARRAWRTVSAATAHVIPRRWWKPSARPSVRLPSRTS